MGSEVSVVMMVEEAVSEVSCYPTMFPSTASLPRVRAGVVHFPYTRE